MSEPPGHAKLSRTAFELQHLLESKPRFCVLCQFIAQSTTHYVDGLFYENVNDKQTREAIRQARGFCRYHAQFIARQADALGTALIVNDILTNDLRALDGGTYDRPGAVSAPLFGRLFDRDEEGSVVVEEVQCPPCVICKAERDLQELAVDSLREGLGDGAFARIFAASGGLCMPHFRLAFARGRDDASWATVLTTQRRALRDLTAQLQELARKHDYRFREEPQGEEMRSWQQGLNATSGWIEE